MMVVFYLTIAGLGGILFSDIISISSNVEAKTIIVDISGNGNYTKIQEAINNAKPGDTINIWAGMYYENIVVDKTLTVIGNGTSSTIINGSYQGDVVYVSGDWVNLTGFTATNSGQQPGFFYESGIKLDKADNAHIYNIFSTNNDYAICLKNSHNNLIENSNLSLNAHGSYFFNSNNNSFINNSNINSGDGIWVKNSENIKILNNTFRKIFYPNSVSLEINLENVKFADVRSNKMNHGFYIWGDDLAHWNSHNIDSTNLVKKKQVLFWKNRNGGVVPQNNGQIILANCTGVTVSNYNFDKIIYGIILGYSSGNIVTNNKAHNSSGNIFLMHSDKNTISVNKGQNLNYGLILIGSENNTISNNSATSCLFGLSLNSVSNNNKIIQNSFNVNDIYGMRIASSDNNKIYGNNVTNNWGGIVLSHSNGTEIVNNNAIINDKGILNIDSSFNKIIKNNVSNNLVGIELERSHSNYVEGNNIKSNRESGIYLNSADGNNMVNNTISSNNEGLTFTSSNLNKIYYNNIISNTRQVSHSGTNYWNNLYNEGNYWSDYSGADDGSNGRTSGDGIGDTKIPHLGLDNYPFMIPSGWKYFRSPTLSGPDDFVSDGNYTISWNRIVSASEYILEEDVTSAFGSPKVSYNGPDLSSDFTYKENGTYYYRIMCKNETQSSTWSATRVVVVDWLPAVPQNIVLSPYPQGNAINISWKQNDIDTIKYEIHFKNAGQWEPLEIVPHPSSTFNHTALTDGLEHLYKIRSKDYRGQYSPFSSVLSCIPSDSAAPSPPSDLKADVVSNSEISLKWNASPEEDISGYFIFMNSTPCGSDDKYNLIGIQNKKITDFTVNGLSEKVEYYFKIKAFDEVPNNSSFSNKASAITPDGTPPASPNGLFVLDRTPNSLTVGWEANSEPDLAGYCIYGTQKAGGTFIKINYDLIKETRFTDKDLKEASEYYYTLKAVDEAGLESEFSEVLIGKTLNAPAPPEFIGSILYVIIEEDSIDDSINLTLMFQDINEDPLQFSCTGQKHVEVLINYETGQVILSPKPDWNGEETLTFYAYDGLFNTSAEIYVTVKPVNDPPCNIEIEEPLEGKIFGEGENIKFIGKCSDPDLPNDLLIFTWYSNISGMIGVGENLNEIQLQPGKHQITLMVHDQNDKSLMTSINITVKSDAQSNKEKSDKTKENEENTNTIFYGAVIGISVISIFVITFIFFKMRRRKVKGETEKNKDLTEVSVSAHTGAMINTQNQIRPFPYQMNGWTFYQYSYPQLEQTGYPQLPGEETNIFKETELDSNQSAIQDSEVTKNSCNNGPADVAAVQQ
jgi:parallel beta-helix repeat protein